MENAASVRPPRTVSGRWVVVAMFAFGIAATGGIWVYWKLHLAPFMPLQKALAAEFEKSSPRVDGGWTKNEYKQSPPLLRVVLRVPYEPDERDARVPATIERVLTLTRAHIDLAAYDTLEIYLVHYVPEKNPQQYEWRRKISEL
ncbi:MAG: hypothetical protein EXS05_08965 [Planctomycetaceae bacterium]|nr:hypothetical protein [Planctomycetaceae bacterium]